MNYANSEKFYTCMATPDLSVIQRFIVPDIVQKFQRPFANPELGYGKITRILIRTQLCVPIQINSGAPPNGSHSFLLLFGTKVNRTLENVVFLLCSSQVYVQFSHSLFSSYCALSEDEPMYDSVEVCTCIQGPFPPPRIRSQGFLSFGR